MITNAIITDLASSVLPLSIVKKHLRIESDFTDEDDLILAYTEAAIAHCENFIGGHLYERSFIIEADEFDSPFQFDFFPVKNVKSVKYYNELNVLQTMAPTNYKLVAYNNKYAALRFVTDLPYTYTRFDAIVIEGTIGYTDIPLPIQQAVLLIVGGMYENREDETKTTFQRISAANNLLMPYKKY